MGCLPIPWSDMDSQYAAPEECARHGLISGNHKHATAARVYIAVRCSYECASSVSGEACQCYPSQAPGAAPFT